MDTKHDINEELANKATELQEENIVEEAENAEEIASCPQCEHKLKEAEEVRLRALAEMENFKKRLQKEKDEQMRYATESVLSDLLPTLDNLDLAIQYGSKDAACQNTMMGVEMTRKLLLDAIKKHGLEPVGTAGETFDPEFHEAIAQESSETIANDCIISVMQKGYVLKGRLLRSAKVSVCKNKNSSDDATA